MIPNNGYFTTKHISGGGFDTIGQPIAVEETDGQSYGCYIQTVTDNKQGTYEDGKFRNSSYILYIQVDQTFCESRVEIFRNGNSLGKFTVQSIEHFMIVGKTKIIV